MFSSLSLHILPFSPNINQFVLVLVYPSIIFWKYNQNYLFALISPFTFLTQRKENTTNIALYLAFKKNITVLEISPEDFLHLTIPFFF